MDYFTWEKDSSPHLFVNWDQLSAEEKIKDTEMLRDGASAIGKNTNGLDKLLTRLRNPDSSENEAVTSGQ